MGTGIPLARAKTYWVLIFKPGEKYAVRFLDEWLGVDLHHDRDARRSHPHKHGCCCHCDLPLRWRAYAPCLALRLHRVASGPFEKWLPASGEKPTLMVFEFTQALAEEIGDGVSLRGRLVEFWKPHGNVNQKLRFEIKDDAPPPELPWFDVRPTLCKMWGDPHAFVSQPERDQGEPAIIPFPKVG